MIIIYLCIFFLGASLASFFNATLYRIEKKYKYPKIFTQGSHCEKCKHLLTWWELIPVLGYFFVGGKCPECRNKINLYYPLSELYLGFMLLSFFIYPVEWYFLSIVLFLFILSYHDVEYRAVPRNIVHLFLSFSFILFLFVNPDLNNILLPIFVSLVLVVANLVKKSFGMGDILILLSLGILFDWANFFLLFFLGIILALLYSLLLIIKGEKHIRKIKIPMIPFFTISFSLIILYGDRLSILLMRFMRIM